MLASVVGIVAYILGSLGYYTIAKVRNIKHGWLAWVPVGNAWLLGSISDQYQLVKNGKKTHRRTVLLVLNILFGLSAVALIVTCVVVIVQLIAAAGGEFAGSVYGEQELHQEMMGVLFGMLGAYVALMIFMIPVLVMQYIALYDVFQSCDPNSSVVYLLLSIFLGISPFLVFSCRYQDYGMPRKNAPQPDAPVYAPPKPAQPKRVPWERS